MEVDFAGLFVWSIAKCVTTRCFVLIFDLFCLKEWRVPEHRFMVLVLLDTHAKECVGGLWTNPARLDMV